MMSQARAIGKPKEFKDEEIERIVFGHHPCPDGITAMVCLKAAYPEDSTRFIGFTHNNNEELMLDKISKEITEAEERFRKRMSEKPGKLEIIFVDVAPSHQLLKKIFEEHKKLFTHPQAEAQPACTIKILDHHGTAIEELQGNKDFESHLSNQQLFLKLDDKQSGVGLAYFYVNALEKNLPLPYALIQATDLLTATGNLKLSALPELKLDSSLQKAVDQCFALSDNINYQKNLKFYVIAGLIDVRMKALFRKYPINIFKKDQDSAELALGMKRLINEVEIFLNNFKLTLEYLNQNDELSTFKQDLQIQMDKLSHAILIPPLCKNTPQILFINSTILLGRTFDLFIADKLKSFETPTIALVGVLSSFDKSASNWFSLRRGDDSINLIEVAKIYKQKNISDNCGGHPSACGAQFNPIQMDVLRKAVRIAVSKPIEEKSKLISLQY